MSYIFINALKFDSLHSRLLAAGCSIDYLFFACAAYFTIERFGRRKVMMTSAGMSSLCWIIIAIVLSLFESGHGNSHDLGIVAVTFFFVFFASFGMGILGVTWYVYSANIQ